MSESDLTLLTRYKDDGAEDAFAELVRRHINLVYSAALRQARSRQLAEEVAQSVFVDLARNAAALKPDTVLAAWLYQVARRNAIDVVRRESRRQVREQIASDMKTLDDADDCWTQIKPLLDEAMESLNASDRAALLLRYFENKSLRDVGGLIGASEDAAQKRVSRAVERLRSFFSDHGVTVGKAGLITMLATQAVKAAPAGLAASISGAAAVAAAALASTAATTTTKTIAMTTLQKTLVATTLVAAVATSLHKSRQAAHFEKEARDAEARRGTEVARLRMARDEVEDRLAAIRAENQRLRDDIRKLPQLRAEISRLQRASEELVRAKSASPEGEFDSSVQSWALRARTLKERLIQTPEAGIPDLQFVTEEDWLDAARDNLDSEAEVLRAFSLLRTAGEQKFARMLTDAVQQFGFHNEKRFPTDLRQLQPYFKMPVNEAILNRWMITSPKEVPNVNFGYDVIITQKEAVDEIFDTRFVVAPGGGHGSTSFPQDFKERLKPLQDAYHAANHGKTPHGKHVMALQEMLPYANPEQRLLIEKVMLQVETNQ